MPELFLSVDQGNSRLKLCLWARDPSGSLRVQDMLSLGAEEEFQKLRDWLRPMGSGLRCALVSVAASEQRALLLDVLKANCLVTQPGHGLQLSCSKPESVGLDRLFAARGALLHMQTDCIVLDAGTALTVDAVLAAEGGIFLGGAIAPGPALLARSLELGAAQLPSVQPRPNVHALGGDTQEAIRAGVGIGFRGAARELAQQIAREAGLEGAPLVLTGGARGFLMEPDCVLGARCVELPELVHRGLIEAARVEWQA